MEVEVSDGWAGLLKSLEDLDCLLHDLFDVSFSPIQFHPWKEVGTYIRTSVVSSENDDVVSCHCD